MRIGSKVTVRFARPGPWGTKFLRCYVTHRLPAGWQLYDPVRNWSWGIRDQDRGLRVIFSC